jgi:hypothetical protein
MKRIVSAGYLVLAQGAACGGDDRARFATDANPC